jgi:hypothetical protein
LTILTSSEDPQVEVGRRARAAVNSTRLAAAHQSGHLEAELKKIRRYKLIIIDEVGYISFHHDAANLFFQLIAPRYEQARSWSPPTCPSAAGARSSATRSSPPR